MRSALPVVMLLVIAALLLPVIAGCGKAKAPEEGNTAVSGALPEAANNAAVSPPAGQPATLSGPLAQLMGLRAKVTSYKVSMTGPDGKTASIFMKMSGGKQAMMKQVTGESWMIMDEGQKVMYMYDPRTKTAIRMPTEGMQEESKLPQGMSPDEDLKALAAQKPKVSEVSLDGVPCLLVEVTDPSGKSGKTWIDKQYGLPRQMEMGGQTMKLKYDMINAVPDSEFKVPAGVKVKDMAEMMKGAGGKAPAMPMPTPSH